VPPPYVIRLPPFLLFGNTWVCVHVEPSSIEYIDSCGYDDPLVLVDATATNVPLPHATDSHLTACDALFPVQLKPDAEEPNEPSNAATPHRRSATWCRISVHSPAGHG
jgi:hypothetical protein